tara:strand:- start:109 stop:387 length:279 start_codon:yes stop_codon:yes gene_type:complete
MKFKGFQTMIHPGEILLKDFIEPKKLSQRQFAIQIKWSTKRLNELVLGKRGISAQSAIELSRFLGTSPEFWMSLQNQWDLYKYQVKQQNLNR